MSDYGQEVASRLRVLVDQAGGPKAFADKLRTTDNMVQQYLRGKALPGNKFRQRLRDAGLDDGWVMHGSSEAATANYDRKFELDARAKWPEEWRMIDLLRQYGISSREMLDGILQGWRAALRTATKMVAETTRVKDKTKKKGGGT